MGERMTLKLLSLASSDINWVFHSSKLLFPALYIQTDIAAQVALESYFLTVFFMTVAETSFLSFK